MNLLDFLSEDSRRKNTQWLDDKSRQFHKFLNRALPRNPNDTGHAIQPLMGLMESISPATDVVDAQSSSQGLMNELARGSKINAFGQGARMLASLGSVALPGNLVRNYKDLEKSIIANYDKFKDVKVDPLDEVSKADFSQGIPVYQGRGSRGAKDFFNPDGVSWGTTSKESAEQFAGKLEKSQKDQLDPSTWRGEVHPLLFNIKNPMEVSIDETLWTASKELAKIKEAKEKGFDGLKIVHKALLEDGTPKIDYVAFDKSQVIPNPVKLNPAQQQSQDILDLLKSGKSNQVTDQMLKKADQRYLFENYDLPMDADSLKARAKEMELDTDSFHGTTSAKTSVDGIVNAKGRLFSSDKPEVSNTYGDHIYPLKISSNDSAMTLDAKGSNWNRIPDPYDEMFSPEKTDFSMDTETTLPSLSTNIDMDGGKALTVKNVVDAGGHHTGNPKSYHPSTVTVSHMKNNPLVRSRFARFDPRLKHLKNLSAGIPLGLLPFLMGNKEDQY